MLKTTAIGGHVGIDLLEASPGLAARALEALRYPVDLRCGDRADRERAQLRGSETEAMPG